MSKKKKKPLFNSAPCLHFKGTGWTEHMRDITKDPYYKKLCQRDEEISQSQEEKGSSVRERIQGGDPE